MAGAGATLLCQLKHNNKFFGIIGLSDRVTGTPYTPQEIELLDTIISTITPLVANSYLFWDIANLNAWYLDILNSVKHGVFVFDSDFHLKKVNSSGLDILRTFSSDEIGPADFEDAPMADVFPDTAFEGWAEQFTTASACKQAATIGNIVARGKDDERIYSVSITSSVERAEIGAALIITLDDVTKQRKSEQRLFDLQKLADKGLMAASIAHELNNFLALILGGIEIIGFAITGNRMEKAHESIAKLKENVAKMERFTNGLMDLSRPKSVKKLSSLTPVIGDVLSFLSVQKRFKNVTITPVLEPTLPDLELDKDQMAQLLMNLLNNAADAIKESGCNRGKITIRTGYDDQCAWLSVSDSGAGIKEEVKERLFASRITTKETGHGHGLMTCAKIVEDHDGSITVDSVLGKGTAFKIQFPLPPHRSSS
ncbi:MAG: ATP-binding protein [Candidatus Eisenbacteria bacterium]